MMLKTYSADLKFIRLEGKRAKRPTIDNAYSNLLRCKMRFFLIHILIVLIYTGCKTDTKKKIENSKYDVKINYMDRSNINWRNNFDDLISKDSIYLFVEDNFNNQLLDIYLNGALKISDTIITDSSLGLARVYTFSKRNSSTVGIRINTGKLLLIEPNSDQNIWRINFYGDSLLSASYSEHAPYYD